MPSSLAQSSINYYLCVNPNTPYNTTLTDNFIGGNLVHVSDIFLLASGNVGLAVAFIAFSVVCLNGLASNMKWKSVGSACVAVSVLVYSICAVFYAINYKQQINDPDDFIQPQAAWQYIYYYTYGIYAAVLVILFIVFYLCTFYQLQIIKVEYGPTKHLMLNMIQAVTISNLVSWIPYIVGNYLNIKQTDEMLNPAGFYETDFTYYFTLYLWSSTVYSKGLYHLIALYLSERLYSQPSSTESSIKMETILWQTTVDTVDGNTL
ncbi:hypothetical protein HDV01_001701 [Terramyces sp. JEL0728]|nr:hypothetical protein HDV01_001701 [Terramyces sp. JEL0728]